VGWRGTFVLAALLAVAGFYLYREVTADNQQLSLTSIIEGPRDAPPGERITHLLSFDPASVTAVRVQRGEQQWRSERVDSTWTGVEQSAAIDDFLTNLRDLAEIMQLDVTPAELRDHGLDPPQAVIELQRAGQPPIVLLLGQPNPPATGVYAQVGPGGRVVLTGALALWELDKLVRALSPTAAAQ
jgi:hypothetical protein